MSWEPKNKTIVLSQILINLFGYLESNQIEALKWANNGVTGEAFQKFYTSSKGRISTVFPALALIKFSSASDFTGDTIKLGLQFTFEGQLKGGVKDELVMKSLVYSGAVESMLTDMPIKTLVANAFDPLNGSIQDLATDHDTLSNKAQTSFLQVFQTQVTYFLVGAGF